MIRSSALSRTASTLTVLGEAALAFRRGNKKVAALLVAGAVLAYRSMAATIGLEVLYRAYRRFR